LLTKSYSVSTSLNPLREPIAPGQTTPNDYARRLSAADVRASWRFLDSALILEHYEKQSFRAAGAL
jgi:hypothetical protein